MKVEAVIFDWDGTLVDLNPRELYCINKALASVSSTIISKQHYIEEYYSHPYKEAGARNLIRRILRDEAAAEKAVETYSNKFSKTLHLIKLQEKAFNVLKALKSKGMSLAVTTLRRRRMLVEQEMQYLNVNGFFDFLVTREDIGLQPWLKKLSLSLVAERRAQQFQKTFTLLRTEPSKTIIVGDSWWDIRAAKQVRAITVWVKTGFGAYNDFSREEPDITLNNLTELLKHV